MIVIGLDIGTTSISGLAADLETGAVIESATIPNDSRIRSDHEWESCQDPEKIWSLAAGLLDRLIDAHAPVAAIGLTGQMHGIVYLDQDGQAVSPLYTWQDQRGSLPDSSGVSAAEQLARTTGCFLAAGYGSATHAYNCRQHLVPNRACCFTTIQDYLGLRLTRRRKPLVHASNAASFGLYALTEGRFDLSALRKAGLDASFFPETTNETLLLGYYRKGNHRKGIPVAVAIGDNQASFIGSVRDPEDSILVNIGTGGQISVWAQQPADLPEIESRPYVGNSFLLVGSTLCGGRAYALLERFFRRCLELAGQPAGNLYPLFNDLAAQNLDLGDLPVFRTTFAGTRQNPSLRGSISQLGINNFTPEHWIVGMLAGMAEEMHGLYRVIESAQTHHPARLIGSGNGIRQNPALRRIIARQFQNPLQVPVQMEEAALGAALFASVAADLKPSLVEAQKIIRYGIDER